MIKNICVTTDLPDQTDYFRLFESTGWNKNYGLSPQELLTTLRKAWFCLFAYDGNHLVGSVRIMSDGIFDAVILDLIVLPRYQRQGIGTRLLDMALERIHHAKIREVGLFPAPGKSEFYCRFGFRIPPDNEPGMRWLEKEAWLETRNQQN